MAENNIYTELSMKTIRDGKIFANPIIPIPNLTITEYNNIQNAIMDLLKQFNVSSEALVGTVVPKPPTR